MTEIKNEWLKTLSNNYITKINIGNSKPKSLIYY